MSNFFLNIEHESRSGSRGGRGQAFDWESLKNTTSTTYEERASYLGASQMIGTQGKFGKFNKNDWWRTKVDEENPKSNDDDVRDFEAELYASTLGFDPSKLKKRKKEEEKEIESKVVIVVDVDSVVETRIENLDTLTENVTKRLDDENTDENITIELTRDKSSEKPSPKPTETTPTKMLDLPKITLDNDTMLSPTSKTKLPDFAEEDDVFNIVDETDETNVRGGIWFPKET